MLAEITEMWMGMGAEEEGVGKPQHSEESTTLCLGAV